MDILGMSLSASLFIGVVLVLRWFTVKRLPKVVFLVLWAVALGKLLVPVSVSSPVSVHQLWEGDVVVVSEVREVRERPSFEMPVGERLPVENVAEVPWRFIGWGVGFSVMVSVFVFMFFRDYGRLKTALPILKEPFIERWMAEHSIRRPLKVLVSDGVATPITIGVCHPKIILPKDMNRKDERVLSYVLMHELQHVLTFDQLWKFALVAVLCVHWFNPLVWVMYVVANQDLELACDERVLRAMGVNRRGDYARVFIELAANSPFMPLCSGFSKNKTKERVECMMRTKKFSFGVSAVSCLLVAVVVSVFATGFGSVQAQDLAELGFTVVTEDQFDQWMEGRLEIRRANGFSEDDLNWLEQNQYKNWRELLEEGSTFVDYGDGVLIFSSEHEVVEVDGFITWMEELFEKFGFMSERQLDMERVYLEKVLHRLEAGAIVVSDQGRYVELNKDTEEVIELLDGNVLFPVTTMEMPFAAFESWLETMLEPEYLAEELTPELKASFERLLDEYRDQEDVTFIIEQQRGHWTLVEVRR